MQIQTRFWSRLGVLGGVYALLFVIANFLVGEPGSGTAGPAVAARQPGLVHGPQPRGHRMVRAVLRIS